MAKYTLKDSKATEVAIGHKLYQVSSGVVEVPDDVVVADNIGTKVTETTTASTGTTASTTTESTAASK